MRFSSFVVACIAVLAAPCAFGQAVTVPGGSAMKVRIMPPAPVIAPPANANAPAHVAKALEFVTVSGMRDIAMHRAFLAVPVALAAAHQQSKSKDAAYWGYVETELKKEINKSVDDVVNAEARVYASHFSDADLDTLIAFYKSDARRKMFLQRPALMRESAAVSNAWTARMNGDIVKNVLKEASQAPKASAAR